MEFNGHTTAASLSDDIMVWAYLKTDCSDPSPRNEEGLPSPFLSPLPHPPFLSHPPLTSTFLRSPLSNLALVLLLLQPLFLFWYLRNDTLELQLVNSEFRAKEKVNIVVLSRRTNKYS